MEYNVFTPTFVNELIYVSLVCVLSKERFDDFAYIFTQNNRPASVLKNIETLVNKNTELIPKSLEDHMKVLKLILKHSNSTMLLVSDIVDNVQQTCNFNIEEVLVTINKDFMSNMIEKKFNNIVTKIKKRLEFLEIKPYLKQLNKILSGENVLQIEDFLSNVRSISKQISEVKERATEYDIFDTLCHNVTTVIENYKSVLDPSQYLTTGYPDLDRQLYGGFAKTRIYVIAGPSGHGKSTYLLNWLVRAVQNCQDSSFLYVTLENIVPETMLRLACILTKQDILQKAYEDPECLSKYLEQVALFLQSKGNRTIIKYFSPTTDINTIIEDIKVYAKETPPLRAIYYDYLNVMSLFSDDMRKYLGQLVRKLKDLAVELQIPVITAAQLNRSAYEAKRPVDVGLHNMAESMLIVENADVILLTNASNSPGSAHLQIKKRRYAREGYLTVRYDASTYTVKSIFSSTIQVDENSMKQVTNLSPFN